MYNFSSFFLAALNVRMKRSRAKLVGEVSASHRFSRMLQF